MKNEPLKYYDKDIDKLFYIPVPAVTIDKVYRECPNEDYHIYLCSNIECGDCLISPSNKEYLTKFNKIKL